MHVRLYGVEGTLHVRIRATRWAGRILRICANFSAVRE
jgi:hypothetical protein